MNPEKTIWVAVLLATLPLQSAAAAPSATAEDAPLYEAKTLDGVVVEAVETYLNPGSSELTAGIGWFPFNPYYNGMALTAGFTYHFSRSLAWEVISGSYAYTFQRGLTAELADSYGVNPQSIERLSYIAASNLVLTHSNGKLIFLDDYVRYFRSSILLGPGLVSTSTGSRFAVSFGVGIEVFSSRSFSWKLDVRNQMTTPDLDHYVAFTLGTGFYF